MEQIQNQLIQLLQFVIGGVISVAGIYITMYINKTVILLKSKVENIKDEQAKILIDRTLDQIDELIKTNIISVENTMKGPIVDAIKDGKVDKSELNSLAIIVKENVLNQLGNQAIKIFNDNLNDTNSYLENRIEKILAELKNADGTEVNKTIIESQQNN